MAEEPKWRRRKEERPADIVQAALAVFSEKGFAGARMDEIAARAGVSKGALYLYFKTKEEIFGAVVREAVLPHMANVIDFASSYSGPIVPLLHMLGERLGAVLVTSPAGRVAKMVIGESGNFPELARIWHDAIIANGLGALTKVIEGAQARGEVRAGDARTFAVSIISPLLVSVLFRETFVPVGAKAFDIPRLIDQHLDTVIPGLLVKDAST